GRRRHRVRITRLESRRSNSSATAWITDPRTGRRRSRGRMKESTIQASILRLLDIHPKVAWAERMNSGVAKLKGFRVRFGFVGCADIIGQLVDGRLLAIECKNESGQLTEEQAKF